MREFVDGVAGEGMIKDLSLSENIIGNAPVSIGMVLALHIFVPGDPELLRIDHATVKWVKRADFGVDFDTHEPKVAERITQVIKRADVLSHINVERSA